MATIKNLTVFCGSKVGVDPDHEAQARRLGQLLAEKGIGLIYGGGRIGLMGAVADATHQAGGRVIGVIPEFLLHLEVGNDEAGDLIVTESMHTRKAKMFELSDASVALPGGLGTLDETFEVMTWKQLRQHDKPIVLININDYWRPFLDLMDAVIDGGFAHPKIRDLISVASDADDVFRALEEAPETDAEVLTSHL